MTAARTRAFRHALEDGVAERRIPTPVGDALLCGRTPDVYDANFLRVEGEPPPAEELARLADEFLEPVFHRRVDVDRAPPELVAGFRALGWIPTGHVIMASQREPDRRVDTSMVREVTLDELVPVRRHTTLSEPWGNVSLAEQLDAVKRRVITTVPTRFFAALSGGDVAAYCELRSDGRLAQIEDVNTLAEFRGRGLARAVVQHALDAAAGHELVFIEALIDDWPRELYAKLGFAVVDERYLFLRPPHALTRLRIRTPWLELRLATRAELRALAAVARAGIHDPDEMPFAVPWTDASQSPGFESDFVAFHEQALRDWRPDGWTLNLVAFLDGQPVGSQSLEAERFASARTVSTGSWLGRAWQGQGLGTEMRAAVVALAFDGLGATLARSGAIVGNERSRAVSRKLGYAEVGTSTVAPRGRPVLHHDLELRSDQFRGAPGVVISGLEHVRGMFGA
jgi:RimJ/RimL family protein N-acetyltransferase/predicted GNAT family acetyltransferase